MSELRTTQSAAEKWAKHVMQKQDESGADRYLVGVVGYPGAGKSTFAAQLVEAINHLRGFEIAVVVPMDGYHYSNEELDRRGLRPLKGIPDTFDAEGFVRLISELKACCDKSIYCPLFDRSIEASIENEIEVKGEHKIVVSEGNYFLLDREPWKQLPDLFDEIWFINSSLEIILPRLLERHKACGRDEAGTRAKIESTDFPNAKLIEGTRSRATRIIDL